MERNRVAPPRASTMQSAGVGRLNNFLVQTNIKYYRWYIVCLFQLSGTIIIVDIIILYFVSRSISCWHCKSLDISSTVCRKLQTIFSLFRVQIENETCHHKTTWNSKTLGNTRPHVYQRAHTLDSVILLSLPMLTCTPCVSNVAICFHGLRNCIGNLYVGAARAQLLHEGAEIN